VKFPSSYLTNIIDPLDNPTPINFSTFNLNLSLPPSSIYPKLEEFSTFIYNDKVENLLDKISQIDNYQENDKKKV